MDRRTKIILLAIGSVLLLVAVIWFVVWPLLKPVLPKIVKQPPAPQSAAPVVNVPSAPAETATPEGSGVFTYETYQANPDIAAINEMKRRAGIVAERAESGSSANGFSNFEDAALDTTPKLTAALSARRAEMAAAHPKNGPLYLTIATRIVEIPENDAKIIGSAFTVRVQLRVDVRDGERQASEYREATVGFVLSGAQWRADTYEVKPYSP